MTYIASNIPEGKNRPKNTTASIDDKSFLDELSPQGAMIVGLISSILIICTIGFFILLIWYFKG
jgi:hypothetical protein